MEKKLSDSGYICEDSREAVFLNGWDTLKESLSLTEKYCEKVNTEYDERKQLRRTELTSAEFEEYEKDHVENNVFYKDEFPYILRNSYFVSAYSLLEHDLLKICNFIRVRKSMPSELDELKVLDKIKKYAKHIGFDIYKVDPLIWQEIKHYSKIRNCIVHNNGFIKNADPDLTKYVEKNILKTRVIDPDYEIKEIGLTKEFCTKVIETLQRFVDSTYKKSIETLNK